MMSNFKENLFNKDVMSLDTYIMFKLKEETARLKPELIAKNRAPISLSMGAPTANPPKALVERLKQILDEDGIHTYSTPKGEDYYRKAVAQRMKNRFGVELDPDKEIYSLVGSKEGIANLIRFLITQKDTDKDIIMVPDPCYASYLQFIQCAGGEAYPIPLTAENHYMPDLDEVWDKFVKTGHNPENLKALIINYPNNPLGVSATRDYVKSAVDFCKKHKILLISDLAYSDLYFSEDEKPFSVFEIEGAKDIAVEFHSFSKPYAVTGWRLGWVCGNEFVVQRLGKGKSTVDRGNFELQRGGRLHKRRQPRLQTQTGNYG